MPVSEIKFSDLRIGQRFRYEVAGTVFCGMKTKLDAWLLLSKDGQQVTCDGWNDGTRRKVIELLDENMENYPTTLVTAIKEFQANQQLETKGPNQMFFSVMASVKVTRTNADGTLTQVERVVLDVPMVVAPDATTAALIAGRRVDSAISDEEMTAATVKVVAR